MDTNNAERERFEQAAYAYYLERHAAGKTEDSAMPPGAREHILWRKEDDTYGVLMFNAAWWAWETSSKQKDEQFAQALDQIRHLRSVIEHTVPNCDPLTPAMSFDPNNPADKIWDAMFDPAASRAVLPVTDDMVLDAVIAFTQAGKRGCDMFNAMQAAVKSAIALATPVAGWVSVEERLPECDMRPESYGVEVIVYPPPGKGESTAFFGCRLTSEPTFYKYGTVVSGVTRWMPLPPAPASTPTQQNQQEQS